jgi:hypothetical protein
LKKKKNLKSSGKVADIACYTPQIVAFLELMWFKSYNFFRKRGYRRSSFIFFSNRQSPIANRQSSIVYRHLQLALQEYYSATVFGICYFPFANRHRHQPSTSKSILFFMFSIRRI